jgi:hypothetical protein
MDFCTTTALESVEKRRILAREYYDALLPASEE